MALIISLIALLIAPVLYRFANKNKDWIQFLDGFCFVSLAGLILVHFLPYSDKENSLILFGLVGLGFLGPNIFERIFKDSCKPIHTTTLFLGIAGLLVHAAIDGAALVVSEGAMHAGHLLTEHVGSDEPLALAIIIHRLPIGLAIWWLLRPVYSKRVAWSVLVAMCGFTIAGYSMSESLLPGLSMPIFSFVQAFVAGSILHVVFFRFHLVHTKEEDSCCSKSEPLPVDSCCEPVKEKSCCSTPKEESCCPTEKGELFKVRSWPESLGNLTGALVLLILFWVNAERGTGHMHHEHLRPEFFDVLLTISLQVAPALLIAHLLAGLLFGLAPDSSLRWVSKGGSMIQAVKGTFVGLPLPVCSCGILPLYKTLVERGIGASAGLAFLLATPELGIDAVLISFPLLGGKLAVIRVVAAAILALTVSLVVSRFIPTRTTEDTEDDQIVPLASKLREGLKHGLLDLVDTTGPWIVFGVLLGAAVEPLLAGSNLALPYSLDIVVFALFGIVFYVCASGATPLVAVLIASGVSPGAGLVFLLTGPATNVSTFGVLSSLHGKKVATLFAISTAGVAILLGVVTNLLFPEIGPTTSALHSHEHFGWLHYSSLFLVVLLYASSIFRRGARGFVGEIIGQQSHG